jgi:excisionase family DNA binding protein
MKDMNGLKHYDFAMEDRFLTPVEAARYLGGINARTLTRWAREGYLPAIPMGEGKRRIWRFLARDLDTWMRARRTGNLPSNWQGPGNTIAPAADAPIGGIVR